MKKSTSLLIILGLFLTATITNGSEIPVLNKEIYTEKNELDVNPIIPKNDAYHGNMNFPSFEWWYFDAILDDNYSAQVGIRVLSFRKLGFVNQIINIYNNSKVEERETIKKPLRYFQISQEFPDVRYKNEPLLKFNYDEYNKTGSWNYTITIEVGKIGLDLTFVGRSEGFTYVTSHEAWTVAQPIADVFGTITINEKKRQVSGTGYHDHNWNFSLKTGVRATGWYWGKIMSENYSLTWAKIKKTRFSDDTIADNIGILSILDSGYIGLNPDNINFIASGDKSSTIPTKFSLYAKQDNLELNITFDAVGIQNTLPEIFTVNYWRYFISINGYIRIGENIDYLEDDIQIMEVIRFR